MRIEEEEAQKARVAKNEVEVVPPPRGARGSHNMKVIKTIILKHKVEEDPVAVALFVGKMASPWKSASVEGRKTSTWSTRTRKRRGLR